MTESAIIGLVFGILFLLNIVSLLCFKFTKIGKFFSDTYYKDKREGIIITISMLFAGICFWVIVLYVWIRYGKVWKETEK